MGLRMRLFILFCLVIPLHSALADGTQWHAVPKGRLFPTPMADPREIRSWVAVSGPRLSASLANHQSFFSASPEDGSWRFHFGIEGRAYFTLRQQGGRFPLETVDGTIGLYSEYAVGDWQWQLRYIHVSAHLADGLSGNPIAYSRETVSLRSSYSPSETFQMYAGISNIVNTMPKVPVWGFQIGANGYFLDNGSISPFLGFDLRWQGDSPANPCFALQLGLAFHGAESLRRSLRLYYSYYTGADLRGQFYQQTSTLHSFAIELPL